MPFLFLAVCAHRLSPRIAIVFSLLSSAPKLLHFAFVYFPHVPLQYIPFLLLYFTLSKYVSSTLLLSHKGASVRLLPPLDYWYISYIFSFFLAGPGPLHEIAVPAFSRTPLGRANRFHSCFFSQPPVNLFSVPHLSPCFLALSFPLFLIAFFTSVLYPPNISMGSIPSWDSSYISFHIFSTTLSHLSPARPFVIFSHKARSALADNLFFGILLTYI